MIGNSLLTQIIVAAIAIGIIITYIQPKFSEIKTRQDEIALTKQELEKVTAVNAQLDELYRQLTAISQQNKSALLIYLPDQIDEVQVLKDLSLMARDAQIELKDVKYESKAERPASATDADAFAHRFGISFESSYENMKVFLSYLERNNYPLVVENMTVKPTQGGFLVVDIGLLTYSFKDSE